jgi:hypothetical protein
VELFFDHKIKPINKNTNDMAKGGLVKVETDCIDQKAIHHRFDLI